MVLGEIANRSFDRSLNERTYMFDKEFFLFDVVLEYEIACIVYTDIDVAE